MFDCEPDPRGVELGMSAPGLPAGEAGGPLLCGQDVERLLARLARVDRSIDDEQRIEQIRLLERLKSAAAAAQAVLTADFAVSQRAEQRAAGVRAERVGQGIGAQVALARRESPFRGSRHLGLAEALVNELPNTLAALRAGETSEWRATIVARETACLSADDRRAADAELSERLARMGDGEVEAAARRVAYRLDPYAFTARTRGADKDRRVTLRPAPDTMGRLTGFLPVAKGVEALASLGREADRLRGEGDPRSRSQIMADLFHERLTGRRAAEGPSVELNLVMTDAALLNGDEEPVDLVGGVPIPAPVARELVRDQAAQVWVRRLFTRPDTGALVAMESRRTHFPEGLRTLLVLRDQVCRTPWCGAPVRHADHVVGRADGGSTSEANGQGLCETCNYAKATPGWQARPGPGGAGHEVVTTTPTGHAYTSHPPPLPGRRPSRRDPDAERQYAHRALDDGDSLIERYLRELLAAA